MRVLFLSDRWPKNFDEFSYGTAIRMQLMLGALQVRADHIDLLFFAPPLSELDPATLDAARQRIATDWGLKSFSLTVVERQTVPERLDRLWRDYLRPALDARRQPMLAACGGEEHQAAFEACLTQSPDLIFVHRLASMMPLMRSRRALPPVFLDLDDIEHRRFARLIDEPPMWRSKKLLKAQVPALERIERKAVEMTQGAFVCSTADAVFLNQRWRCANVFEVPNSVPDRGVAPFNSAPTVLFLGILNYRPNSAGAEWFIDAIWPQIRAVVPEAQLIVAGKNPDSVRQFKAPPGGVSFPGFVKDLTQVYADARVVICPIRSGSGTRVKIIEAASFSKPIVSTQLGAEGLSFQDGSEILLRDTASAFADAVVELLQSDARAIAIGQSARLAFERDYFEPSVRNRIATRIFEAA